MIVLHIQVKKKQNCLFKINQAMKFNFLIILQSLRHIIFGTEMKKTQIHHPFDHSDNSKESNHKKSNTELDSDSDSDHQQTQQQQLPSPAIQFKDSPVQMKCPFCLQNIRTQVILKPQFISILLGFALFVMLPNFLTLVLTLIILQITSTRKHRCPLCQRQLGSDGKFLIFFDDQIYSFAIGTNGIIVSKKILASIGIGILIFVMLSIKVNNAYADVTFTDLTWPQFARQCPYDSKQSKCMYQNEGLTVKNWKGFVMRVQDNRNSMKRHFMYAVSLYIKMNDPMTLNVNRQQPDFFLTVTSYQAHQWQQKLDKLSHGDEIVFNATFQQLRNSKNIPVGRHLNIIEFNETGLHNPQIHVFMSEDEDQWFFQNLSGEKLRKHDEHQNENQNSQKEKDKKAIQSQPQIQKSENVEEKQKLIIQDTAAQTNKNDA